MAAEYTYVHYVSQLSHPQNSIKLPHQSAAKSKYLADRWREIEFFLGKRDIPKGSKDESPVIPFGAVTHNETLYGAKLDGIVDILSILRKSNNKKIDVLK